MVHFEKILTFNFNTAACLICFTVTGIFSLIFVFHLLNDQNPSVAFGSHCHHLGGLDFCSFVEPPDRNVFTQLTVQSDFILLDSCVILQFDHKTGSTLCKTEILPLENDRSCKVLLITWALAT